VAYEKKKRKKEKKEKKKKKKKKTMPDEKEEVQEKNKDDEIICSICLEVIGDDVRTATLIMCMHDFHEECLSSWMVDAKYYCFSCDEEHANTTCPMCRGDGRNAIITEPENPWGPIIYLDNPSNCMTPDFHYDTAVDPNPWDLDPWDLLPHDGGELFAEESWNFGVFPISTTTDSGIAGVNWHAFHDIPGLRSDVVDMMFIGMPAWDRFAQSYDECMQGHLEELWNKNFPTVRSCKNDASPFDFLGPRLPPIPARIVLFRLKGKYNPVIDQRTFRGRRVRYVASWRAAA
jgi:hypothetical protein